ncbi:MAG: PilN domain-containing protein [Deltaproteobacteria bacterium]
MIRINLLPIKQIRQKAALRQQVMGFLCLFLLVLVSLAVTYQWQASTISSLNASIAKLNKEKGRYNKIIKEIAELKKTKNLLDAKVNAIKQLKEKSSLAVHIVDEVATRTPQDRMWLTGLTQNGSTLSLQGVALDNATIAQYMQSMEESPYFMNAELKNSSLTQVSGQKLKSFSMTLTIVVPGNKTDKEPAKAS